MYDNFVFYGDVMNSIEQLPTEEDKRRVALAILRYGTSGEITDDDNLYCRLILPLVSVGIDKAKDRYNKAIENGKKGGRAKQFSNEEIAELKKQGLTNKQVAEKMGCCEKTVERANKANRQNEQTITDETDTDRQNLNKNKNININSNSNKNNSSNNDCKGVFADLF